MRKSNKKYRIKSKFRFITFMVIAIGLTVGAFGYISGMGVSTALTDKPAPIQVEVCAGDTLWDIANEYKSTDKDVREAVYEICQANDIKDGYVEAGMIIDIPQNL
ncbi:MAG: LysM peptidoglycan-binding domain-containing protein [Firmicutes bacterium]|nr:LysM peptidoglycan-binding domain-containing protein [Bacillota bacterium]